MNRRFINATATLIGTIVGVGIFGVPYTVASSGFLIGLFLLFVLGGAVLLLHLLYGEIVLRTPGKHRLVGYGDIYLGIWGKRLATLTESLIYYGALLAYIIVAGKFLFTIFGWPEYYASLIFFALFSMAIFFGLEVITPIEFLMALFLILVVLLIFFQGLPAIDVENLMTVNFPSLFLPYGVILWSISGWAAIPEMKDIFKHKCQSFKKAIILGVALPIILYAIFILTIVGITGGNTSKEAISGLAGLLPEGIVVVGALFGFLAVATSFLVIGLSLKKIYWYDYKINKNLAWLITCAVPLAAFLANLRDFIAVIGFLGATLTGLEGILLVLIYKRAKKRGRRQPEYSIKLSPVMAYGLIMILTLGVVYQLVYSVF